MDEKNDWRLWTHSVEVAGIEVTIVGEWPEGVSSD